MNRHLTHFFLLLALLPVMQTLAAEIRDMRVYTEPQKVYVNQPFEFHIEFTVTENAELGNIRLDGMPADGNNCSIEYGEAVNLAPQKETHNNVTLTRTRIVQPAVFRAPYTATLTPRAIGVITENRTNSGFFSFSSSRNFNLSAPALTLNIRPLPAANRPNDFSGTVGTFTINQHLTKTTVRPGDIITARITITGSGYIPPTVLPELHRPDTFKCYPPKIISRSNNHLVLEQNIIPLSTNAVNTGDITLPCFNPAIEQYATARTPGTPLKFLLTAEQPITNTVAVLDVPMAMPTTSSTSLIPRRHATTTQMLRQPTPLHFAPATTSPRTSILPAQSTYRILDSHGDWLHIESGSHRGWIITP